MTGHLFTIPSGHTLALWPLGSSGLWMAMVIPGPKSSKEFFILVPWSGVKMLSYFFNGSQDPRNSEKLRICMDLLGATRICRKPHLDHKISPGDCRATGSTSTCHVEWMNAALCKCQHEKRKRNHCIPSSRWHCIRLLRCLLSRLSIRCIRMLSTEYMLNFSRSVDLSRTCCVVNEPGSAKCPTMYKEYRRVMSLLEMEVIEQAASLSSFVPGGCKTSTSMFNNDFPQLSRCQTPCTPIPLGLGLKRIASSILIIHYQYLPVISISPI